VLELVQTLTSPIRSARLDLVPLTRGFLDAALAGDSGEASRLLDARVPDEWPDLRDTQTLFLERLRAEPALGPWSLRAIVLRVERRIVGQIGCHGPPTPDGVELAYTVFEPDRRRGYAREACRALIDWARREHGVERFVLSIAKENVASLALARSLGSARVFGGSARTGEPGDQGQQRNGPEPVAERERKRSAAARRKRRD
jgi:RimJ/RimL family protein N-acetyltransferase